MKAKTIVGLMACAVLVPAFADTTPIDNNKPTTNDWFSTSVPGSTIVASGATWATGESVTPPTVDATAHVLVIDADTAKPATLTPTVADADTKGSLGVVTIASKAYLAPSAKADLPDAAALGAAQVGFAVATESETTSFYAYTKISDSGVWTKLAGVPPPTTETDTEFTIVLNYNTRKVTFMVGSTTLSVAVASDAGAVDATELSFTPAAAMISDVAAIGSGTITSIDAKFENAVAVKGDTKYATIADAYNASGSGTVKVWDSNTGAVAQEQTAANGLTKAECMALNIAENAAIALEPTTQADDGKITVKTVVNPVDDVTVGFKVVKVTGEAAVDDTSYPANAIKLPKTTGQYRIQPTVGAKSSN